MFYSRCSPCRAQARNDSRWTRYAEGLRNLHHFGSVYDRQYLYRAFRYYGDVGQAPVPRLYVPQSIYYKGAYTGEFPLELQPVMELRKPWMK